MHRLFGSRSDEPRPSRVADGLKFYDALVAGGNSRGSTATIYIKKRIAYEGEVVGGEPSVFGNREHGELKVAVSGNHISRRDMAAREIAQNIVADFNARGFVTKKAYVDIGLLLNIEANFTVQRYHQRLNLGPGTHILVDKKIHGTQKFNSNNGWSAGEHEFPDFLSHWSYVDSRSDHLLCNLQGHRGIDGSPLINGTDNYYLFKDPVIISRSAGAYGSDDQAGINNWLNRHECNRFCKHFNLDGVSTLPHSSDSCRFRWYNVHYTSLCHLSQGFRSDDQGFDSYEAQVTGANSLDHTAKIYINNRVVYEGQVVGGDPCYCAKMSSSCSCVLSNEEHEELNIARSPNTIGLEDMAAREPAQDIVKTFNYEKFVDRKAYVLAGGLLKNFGQFNQSSQQPMLEPGPREHVLIDKQIPGPDKFYSNNGWSSGEYHLPDFLTHWSHVYSGGHHLLCELKGHSGVQGSPLINGTDDYYLFKYPVIVSKNAGNYGNGDRGHRGIDNCLRHHEAFQPCRRRAIFA